MSQENVQATRESMAAYNRRDFDAAVERFDPEVEWVFPPRMGADSRHGPEDVKRFWRELDEVFESFRLEPLEFVDAGDRVAVRLRFHGRGKGGGVAVDEAMFHQVTTFRDGRIVRMEYVSEWREALAAAGLSE